MNKNSLSIEQVRIFASTLRRRANSTLQEYIASAQGWGTLSAAALSVRFELFNEVVAEVQRLAPDFAEHIPFFDVTEEVESAFARIKLSPLIDQGQRLPHFAERSTAQ